MWYVYILRCRDGSLYTGISNDIQKRLSKHNSGKASKYTRARRPLELVYTEKLRSKPQALRREAEIKSLSAQNKRQIVNQGISAEKNTND
jgi:putative endonuclease